MYYLKLLGLFRHFQLLYLENILEAGVQKPKTLGQVPSLTELFLLVKYKI